MLIPLATFALVGALTGRAASAGRWWRTLPPVAGTRRDVSPSGDRIQRGRDRLRHGGDRPGPDDHPAPSSGRPAPDDHPAAGSDRLGSGDHPAHAGDRLSGGGGLPRFGVRDGGERPGVAAPAGAWQPGPLALRDVRVGAGSLGDGPQTKAAAAGIHGGATLPTMLPATVADGGPVRAESERRRLRAAAVVGHAVISALLGAVAILPLGVLVLVVLRGMFYGLVDPGPYDTSWGGPTRAGAWTAHFLIGLPMAAAAVLVLIGIATVHARLTRSLLTGRRPGWAMPVALLVPVPAVLFFVAWLHQI
jgi:hypothetical protein